MGEAKRKRLNWLKADKDELIRELAVKMAYKRLYKDDPFLANMMLLVSELTVDAALDLENIDEISAFLNENKNELTAAYVKRFKSIDDYALKNKPARKKNEN